MNPWGCKKVSKCLNNWAYIDVCECVIFLKVKIFKYFHKHEIWKGNLLWKGFFSSNFEVKNFTTEKMYDWNIYISHRYIHTCKKLLHKNKKNILKQKQFYTKCLNEFRFL